MSQTSTTYNSEHKLAQNAKLLSAKTKKIQIKGTTMQTQTPRDMKVGSLNFHNLTKNSNNSNTTSLRSKNNTIHSKTNLAKDQAKKGKASINSNPTFQKIQVQIPKADDNRRKKATRFPITFQFRRKNTK